MTLDILAALEASPSPGDKRCKLAEVLAEIPADAPGRDQLLARVADPSLYPAQKLTLTFTALGRPVGKDLIADHRAERCRCYR